MSTPVSLAIRNLLRFTRTHLRHHEALMRATGGHFNLFQILGIGHYEVKTHSPILAELLDPQGRHGQGGVFLRLFLERLGIADLPFQASRTRVETERYIGPKTETEGGQIDIVIEDGVRRRILIENKIYASDQDNQLLRYHNYDKKAVLIYLTLDGKEASEYSAKGLESGAYERISYEIEIRDWLMECRKEATCLPVVRETISQYINLIEQLTNQSTTKQMNENLINEIVDTPENLEAFYALRNIETELKRELVRQLDLSLEQAGAVGFLRKAQCLENLQSKASGFDYVSPELDRLNLKVRFEFDTSDYRDFAFGFRLVRDGQKCPVRDQLLVAFKAVFQSKTESPSEPWPAWAYFDEPYRSWYLKAFEGIRSGDLAKNIGSKLEMLNEIAQGVCEAQCTDTDSKERLSDS